MSNVLPFPDAQWMRNCHRTEAGQLIANVHNAILASRSIFYKQFALDQMSMKIIKAGNGEQMTDVDVTLMQSTLQDNGFRRISLEIMWQTVGVLAQEWGYHPVKQYLEGLKWDGVSRIDNWTETYLGSPAETKEYSAAVGKMFLISMIARIYKPGCKVDHVPVLEGKQGLMKSSACKVLAGEWFSDSLPEISQGKECSQHLRGKWLIEIAEMHVMKKADANHLKSFVTRTEEKYRPPYGRSEVEEPRQCVFIGTTNQSTYLKDESGNRRFWPIVCTRINIHHLIKDRDQLIAEAIVMFKAGVKWWPDKDFEATYIKPQQDARYEPDVWEEAIATFLQTRVTTSISEIGSDCLHIEIGRRDKLIMSRIVAVLENLGWVRGERTKTGVPWILPEKPKIDPLDDDVLIF